MNESIRDALREENPEKRWRRLTREVLTPADDFELHQAAHQAAFADWPRERGPAPVWFPDDEVVRQANITHFCRQHNLADFPQLQRWSSEHRVEFWQAAVARVGIRFRREPERLVDLSRGNEHPAWFPGARLNIVDSCWKGDPDRPAVVYADEQGNWRRWSLRQLQAETARVARCLRAAGYGPGDAIGVMMPMTPESVAIYLGIVATGAVAVSIADSFSAVEVQRRLRIAQARALVTQDAMIRGGKRIPLYSRLLDTSIPAAIVLPTGVPDDSGRPVESGESIKALRSGDRTWAEFLADDPGPAGEDLDPLEFAVARDPHEATNILFSSGTTGDPKAIPWTHTTPIKCAVDGWFHHDVHPGDVLSWPTNLGWMMGPWLIYASLVNEASMALFGGNPGSATFCRFVEQAGVTMLGVIPSLVRTWRNGDCLAGVDWTGLRCFSSTGECSTAEDMFYLMSRAGYRPVIEYCGGTEIGGGYVTGTVVQPCVPAAFSTPALGLDLKILDDAGRESDDGEVFLTPPSLGLSLTLLNRDHHEEYYAGVPQGPCGELLRRHGDQLQRLPGGYFRALGRADDTMNLGGIKVSSAEIERCANQVPGVLETAAVSVPPAGGGPDRLHLFVVLESPASPPPVDELAAALRQQIRTQLNPLFQVHEVRIIDQLPRTASNKVMRRTLRAAPPS